MSSDTDTTTAASTDTQPAGDSDPGDGEETVPPLQEDEEEHTPVAVEHAPPRESQGIALGAAVVGAALTTPFALLALPFGLAGVVVFAGGLIVTNSRGWLTIGTALVLIGTILTGAYGAVPAELMLVGVTATVLAWDVGQHGIGLGQQLGADTRIRRALFVHTAISTVVLGSISTVVYLISLVGPGGRPAPAVAVAVIGIVAAAWMLRN